MHSSLTGVVGADVGVLAVSAGAEMASTITTATPNLHFPSIVYAGRACCGISDYGFGFGLGQGGDGVPVNGGERFGVWHPHQDLVAPQASLLVAVPLVVERG